MAVCEKCGAELTHDEVGLYRKIVLREAETFLCIPCLAEKFCVPEEDLRSMVERFKRAGCQLFSAV
ncbi:MAG: hypothetical protein IKM46_06255 [Clostridia bacterium]|nr:hypothetical protein [Clostridia bacterium]